MKHRVLWPILALGCVALSAHGQITAPPTAPLTAPPTAPPNPATQGPTDLPRIHDPVMAKEGGIYYLFGTGRGLTLYTSKDRVNWQRQPRVLEPAPAWTSETIPGSRDYWAPDILFVGGKWRLYYSVSTFGKNRSAIGLATNVTLDSSRADYKWQDEGLVTQSQPTDDFNCIDPNLFVDRDGTARLVFGSFWGGIQMLAIDPKTGKPQPGGRPVAVATRSRATPIGGAIEAPFLVRHGDFYFLFCSFDFCCRGINSDYNIRVGRSATLNGPFLDRDGKPMLEGGGTLILAGSGRWHGPGHEAVFLDEGRDYLVYHSYDGEDNGNSKLRMQPITWDAAGWPQVEMDKP